MSQDALEQATTAALLRIPTRTVAIDRHREWRADADASGSVRVVLAGMAARFKQDARGERQICAVHIPGDACDLHGLILPTRRASWVALTDTTLLLIPRGALRTLARSSPLLTEVLWRQCAVEYEISQQGALVLGRKSGTESLAHFICELACRYERIGHPRDRFPMVMTQSMIGETLGLTSVHVNRLMRSLREAGLFSIKGSEVRIHDWARLARAGGFDPAYIGLGRVSARTVSPA